MAMSNMPAPGGRRTNRTWWILIAAVVIIAILIWIGAALTGARNPALTPGSETDATTQNH
jgi:hypothetical protein